MNTLIVCFSRFGNTRAIAEALAETEALAGKVQILNFDQLDGGSFSEINLLIMGCPTHRMGLPRELRPILKTLPRRILHKTPAAVFDTSYKLSPWLAPFSASHRLASVVRRLGGRLVVPPQTFHVIGREGPLYLGEIELAKDWISRVCNEIGSVSRNPK